MSYSPPRNSANVPIVAESDAETMVLPPPSPLNPVPSLPAALRLDNREQLLSLLQTDPRESMLMPASSSPPPRQLLVFANESLRTLLLRQVLTDPESRTYKGKKNWDPQHVFPLPQQRGLNDIVGTRVLESTTTATDAGTLSPHYSSGVHTGGEDPTVTTATHTSHDGAAEVSLVRMDPSAGAVADTADESFFLPNVDVVTYFIRPTPVIQTQQVAARIRSWTATSKKKTTSRNTHHRIVYLPQPSAMCQKILSNLGMMSASSSSQHSVSIHKLQLDVFPLETDVLSLEMPDAVRQVDVEGTPSSVITTSARALLKLQDVVGRIPRIQSLGPMGEEVLRKLMNLTLDEYIVSREEEQTNGTNTTTATTTAITPDSSDIAALLVMDRKVDMVTPMVTPLTYEGLLDDVIGIDCGFIQLDVTVINPKDSATDDDDKQDKKNDTIQNDEHVEIVALPLHGSDTLYAEVRDQHVEKFGSFLQNQAKALKESHAEFTNKGKKKDLTQIQQFVKQMPVFTQNLRTLTNHIHLAELVKQNTEESAFRERWQTERSMLEGEVCYDMLEDLIAWQYPPYRLLRLLCLQSLCGGGIKSSKYDSLRRDVVQTYGYEYLLVLNNLEKAGLLRRRETIWDSSSAFYSLRKSLALIHAEVNTVDPDDVSYVSSGYAPLTVRLVQKAAQGWSGTDDVLRGLLPGRDIDITQQQPPEDLLTAMKRSAGPSLGSSIKTDAGKKPTLMVFFVGGVTFMEIAALRFLSKRPSFPYHVICCTTKVINGNTLLHSLS